MRIEQHGLGLRVGAFPGIEQAVRSWIAKNLPLQRLGHIGIGFSQIGVIAAEGVGIKIVAILVRNGAEGDALRQALCRGVGINLDRGQFHTLHLHRGKLLAAGRETDASQRDNQY